MSIKRQLVIELNVITYFYINIFKIMPCYWFIGKIFYHIFLLMAFINLFKTLKSFEMPPMWTVIGVVSILFMLWRCYYAGMVLFLTVGHFTYSVGSYLCTSHKINDACDACTDKNADAVLEESAAMVENCK